MTGRTYNIFLSYSHRDREFADRLHADLVSEGLTVWRDEQELIVGQYLVEEINKAIVESSLAVCLVSQAYIESPWCRHEARVKLGDEVAQDEVLVLALRLDDTDPEDLFPGKLCLDFRPSSSYRTQFHALMRAVSRYLQKPVLDSGRYIDDPRELRMWSPGRAWHWYKCPAMYWHAFVERRHKYPPSVQRQAKLEFLSGVQTLRQLVGQVVRAEMRRHLRWSSIEPQKLRKRIEKRIHAARRERKLLEVVNSISVNEHVQEAVIRRSLEWYEQWIGSLSKRFSDWLVCYHQEYKVRQFVLHMGSLSLYANHRPFAITRDRSKSLVVENLDNQRSRTIAEQHLALFLLADNQAEPRTGEVYATEVLFLETGRIEEIGFSRENLGEWQARAISKATRYQLDRLTSDFTEKPDAAKCTWCKYMGICPAGQDCLSTHTSATPRGNDQEALPEEQLLLFDESELDCSDEGE